MSQNLIRHIEPCAVFVGAHDGRSIDQVRGAGDGGGSGIRYGCTKGAGAAQCSAECIQVPGPALGLPAAGLCRSTHQH